MTKDTTEALEWLHSQAASDTGSLEKRWSSDNVTLGEGLEIKEP